MTDIQAKIDKLAMDLHRQLEAKEPIDPNRIQQLVDMRRDRDKALGKWQELRLNEMRGHTRTLTSKLTGLKSHGRPDLLEKINEETEKYDAAAVYWVESDVCPWEDSQAASLAAGILTLTGEIGESL